MAELESREGFLHILGNIAVDIPNGLYSHYYIKRADNSQIGAFLGGEDIDEIRIEKRDVNDSHETSVRLTSTEITNYGDVVFNNRLTAYYDAGSPENPWNVPPDAPIRFGRNTEQYITFWGDAVGNVMYSFSTIENPKPFYIHVEGANVGDTVGHMNTFELPSRPNTVPKWNGSPITPDAVGEIKQYTGKVTDIPQGWNVANGTKGTVDMSADFKTYGTDEVIYIQYTGGN